MVRKEGFFKLLEQNVSVSCKALDLQVLGPITYVLKKRPIYHIPIHQNKKKWLKNVQKDFSEV